MPTSPFFVRRVGRRFTRARAHFKLFLSFSKSAKLFIIALKRGRSSPELWQPFKAADDLQRQRQTLKNLPDRSSNLIYYQLFRLNCPWALKKCQD